MIRRFAPVFALACAAFLASCDQNNGQQKHAAAAPAADTAPVPDEEVPLGPLPHVAIPMHYRLVLTVDPKKARFTGHTEIDVTFKEPRRAIFIHGLDIHMDHAVVKLADGRTVNIAYSKVDKSGVARLVFATAVPAGNATLIFDYDAPWGASLAGLYKVTARGDDYAFTQFESTDARRAFPSFDEPGFKTPFDITIIAPVDDKVVANTSVIADTGDGHGNMKWVFETTKPLPTYLVALAVGPLDIVDVGDIPPNQYRDHPLHLRGVTAKGMGRKLQYALSLTPGVITALENYYGIAYPFQKVDILAVPDFAAGAMENAGAVTFRENLLLMDANASLDQKRASLDVQAHELAHQWFGDYVTPAWWDDIWLNESFATWMESKISSTVKPGEEFSRESLLNGLGVMRLDELPSARQIHQPVHNIDDIDNAFDDITYSKGDAVLAMFESYVGPDQWQKGIHAYLTKYAYGNATGQDFITAIAQATGHPEIVDAFNSFINQPGIPLLKTDISCGSGNPSATLTQVPYAPVGITVAQRRWNVPMCATADGTRICRIAAPPTSQVQLGATCPKLLFPNAEGAGYYRFGLAETDWANLIKAAPTLDPADQLTLFHNLNAAMRAGQAPATDYFTLIHALAPVAHWDLVGSDLRASFNIFDTLHDLRVTGIFGPGDLAAEQAFVRANFSARLKKLGLAAKPGEKPADALLREDLASGLVEEGRDPALIARLTKAAHSYLASGEKDYGGIAPDLMQEALRAGVLSEGAPFVDQVLAEIKKSDDENFIRIAIYGVAGTDDTASLNKLFDMSLTPAIRIGDIRYIFRYPSAEMAGRPALWSWFQANYQNLLKRISVFGMSYTPDLQRFGCDAQAKADLDAFFGPKTNEWVGTPRTLRENDDRIDRCMALKGAKGAEIVSALHAAK